eukprot:TRINITY_DN402_c0_g3_i1.p1 TRINITY_DN402_c0_g3~~TRINITY_DN402_c0_g3_i1.p1  ORF type:complete len:454 (-),score=184.89 TRINITY_DN402_c0_g3_i1:155-1516(-)
MAKEKIIIGIFLVFLISFTYAYIPVSVMMPLNTVNNDGTLNNPSKIKQDLQKLKSGSVDGIMIDFWWGIIERTRGIYDFSAYLQLADICKDVGLKLQAVASFHQCGTNVGDSCYILLPQYVLDVGNKNKSIWYTDQQYGIDKEYISLGADHVPLFNGYTAIDLYTLFFKNLSATFKNYIPNILDEVQVGLGPAGEMRYPSYQLQDNKWQYCGIGEFQNYDSFMLSDLQNSANAAGHPEWGHGGPSNAGTYNSYPSQTQFWSDSGFDNYKSDYGKFFLNWYAQKMLSHGEDILNAAKNTFTTNKGLILAAKVSGIHWWYSTSNHAAECTAGYYNTNNNNAYLQIASMFAKYGVTFDFTCLEMKNSASCGSAPEDLVKQTRLATNQVNIPYAGENALPLCTNSCNKDGFNEIIKESTQYGAISRFTYLRLDDNLIYNTNNWNTFTWFVQQMHNAK